MLKIAFNPCYLSSIMLEFCLTAGAILAQESDIHVTGNATFAYNAANRDGGAMKTFDTRLTIGTIAKGAQDSSTRVLTGALVETIFFIENIAFDFGGAISLANPAKLNMSDVTFKSNEAESGGAVSVASTEWATADFQRCRFENNKGTRGGAMYLNGEGQRFLQDSSFRLNVADEAGGALFNAGAVEVKNTVFAENTAADGGLAIHNLESTSAMVLWNVTFDGNILSCPSQTYSYTQDNSPGNCRFELACEHCLDGCKSDLGNVTIDIETLPTCEPIPEGVGPSSTTLQTFDIKKGYYRVSTESPIVLECYQNDACVGGIDPSDYCAVGYSGPYCAVCTDGYARGSSSRCHRCSGENTGFAVGFSTAALFLALFVVVLVGIYLVQKVGGGDNEAQNQPRRWRWWQGNVSRFRSFLVKAVSLPAIRIIVVVLQIVIQFTEIAGTVYPDEYESFLSSMTIVNFDFGSILSSSCLITTDFFDRLVLATVTPLGIYLACAVTFFIAKMRNRNSPSARSVVKNKHLSIALFIVFFVYSSVSFTIFQTFVCDYLDDGKAYLRADYSIECFTERHKAYRLYASLMVCLYPVAIPAFFAVWLVRHRRELAKPDRDTMLNLTSYRCLWGAYKPSCYYYEVVECGRRIVLTGAAVFVLPDTAEQVAIVLLIAVVFVFISESISPFESKADMWTYRWGNGIILASMYLAFLLKVDLAQEGTQSSASITVLLIAAHVFMIFTVAVQAFLLMRGLCISQVTDGVASRTGPALRREEQEDFGIELAASMNT